jgi:hypothetical protein
MCVCGDCYKACKIANPGRNMPTLSTPTIHAELGFLCKTLLEERKEQIFWLVAPLVNDQAVPCARHAWQMHLLAETIACVVCCFSPCSNKYSADYQSACVSCAGLGSQPGNVQKCMGCIARASKVACSDTNPDKCWSPIMNGGTCLTCATSATDYETCVSCLERQPYSDSCGYCPLLEDAAQQAKCFNCTKVAGLPYSTCYDCMNFLEDETAVDQCRQCATNTQAPVEGRQWCYG